MKKMTAIALISIALVSCKKENKNNEEVSTKPNSIQGINSSSADDNVVEEVASVVTPAIAITEKEGIYTHTLLLEKGQTYPLVTYQRTVQTMTGPDGKSLSGTSQSTDDMSFTINDVKDDTYEISINLLAKNNSQSMNGKTITVDTKGVAPKEPQLKMMWNINKALVGNTLQMTMKNTGDITAIKGFEAIYAKVTAAIGTQIKDAQEKNAFLKSFKESFNENTIKEQFTKNLMVLPKNGAKIGQSWTETEDASPDGLVKLSSTYTLKSVENGLVTISVLGGIPKKSDKQTKEGITHTLSSELSQSGTITLDQKTGWVKNQNITLKTTQTESFSDGKETQTMKNSSSSTVIVNPQKK